MNADWAKSAGLKADLASPVFESVSRWRRQDDVRKTVLITGSGTGIGRDVAFRLAARGHDVIATTHDDDQAKNLCAESARRQLAMNIFKLDITNPTDRALVEPLAIDVLINNAAIGESGSLAEIDIGIVRHVFEINLFSTLELTQIVLKGMIARQRGTIIFVSSLAGRIPTPFLMPYAMTKYSLSAAAAALRTEMNFLKKNISISVIEPGAFHTGFNQIMVDQKYMWMQKHSYFFSRIEIIRSLERRILGLIEAKSTASIVAKFIKATEADRPRLRYVAPSFQGILVQLARILGR